MSSASAWEGVPLPVLASIEREAEGREIAGVDYPMANGVWRCGGCGRFLRKDSFYVNRCSDCWTEADEFLY